MMSPRSASLTRCLAMALLLGASLPALAQAPEAPPAAEPLTLDQAMAHPGWTGRAVAGRGGWLAGPRRDYALGRRGAPGRALGAVPAAGGERVKREGAARADVAGPGAQFNPPRRYAVFVRNGDVFLRQLGDNLL